MSGLSDFLGNFPLIMACYNRNRALGLSWVGIPRAQTAQLSPRAYRPSGLVGMSVPEVYQTMTNLGALFLKLKTCVSDCVDCFTAMLSRCSKHSKLSHIFLVMDMYVVHVIASK